MLKTPVVFLIFNRPDLTERVFAAIRDARPSKLLVVADGPREDVEGDAEKCEAAREVIRRVDWPCELLVNFSPINLGCRKRVSSGLDWVFERCEEAIILEDDCLPHPSFFGFCAEMLDRYRSEPRVMHVSGSNFQEGRRRSACGYYFSKYPHIWGWATWRRAWRFYDVTCNGWPRFARSKLFFKYCPTPEERSCYDIGFKSVLDGSLDTWDYQWLLACWSQDACSIFPDTNLISNIGFREDATHTRIPGRISQRAVEELPPLKHPAEIRICKEADRYMLKSSLDLRVGNLKQRICELAYPLSYRAVAARRFFARFEARSLCPAGRSSTVQEPSTPATVFVLDGSPLTLPENHMLPVVRQYFPNYATNIARLARCVRRKYADLTILDIGANVGDTVAILRREVDCPILCIEGSEVFLPFLKTNLAAFKDVEIAPSYVAAGPSPKGEWLFHEVGGTAKLTPSPDGSEASRMRPLADILQDRPRFRNAKLVKIDTDGFDPGIINANIGLWSRTLPVIYFEYDPACFEPLGEKGPLLFRSLAERGYAAMLVYENNGDYILSSMLDATQLIEDLHWWMHGRASHRYLDIAVFCRADLDVWRDARAAEIAFFQKSRVGNEAHGR